MTRRVFISIVVCLLALCAKADLSEIAKSCQITFSYNGEAFDPAKWSPAEQSLDGGLTRVVYTSPDGRLRLTVDYREYADFPVTEIRPVLECVGNAETGIVDNFKSLRLTHACKSQSVKIRRMTGSRSTYSDFCHHDVQLQRRHECDWLHMTSEEGRSAAWLPYFGVDYDSMNGIEVAIGWTGTWRADMQYKHDREYWMEIGLLDSTHFKMLPGERFMMPYTVIYNRCNKSVQNGLVEFHRFIIEHKSPRNSKGELFKPLLPVSASGGNKTDENMLKILNFTKRFDVPFDVYWIDANWYGTPRMVNQDTNCGSDWFDFVGDWRVNTVTHPKGNLKKISDAAHKAGMRFLVWFESERATPKAPILKKHPEYFHLDPSDPDSCDHLLDLGNPEARQWIVEEVSRNIRESGIDIYRQDFNMDPLPAWRANDAPDRKCVTEIKHINGLYAFWDELHRRFPDMMFENCASGGTRTDIEMMSRAHSYCRDDAQMWPNCDELTQNITINSTPYVPFTGGETFSVELYDNYAFLSRLGAGTVFTPSDFDGMILKREPSEKEIKWFHDMFTIANRVRPLFMGDFYALTDNTFEGPDQFAGYQLNDTKTGEGFFMLFRRKACAEDSFYLKLQGIDPDATYVVEQFEGETKEMKGSDFARQILTFDAPRTYKLVFYKKK